MQALRERLYELIFWRQGNWQSKLTKNKEPFLYKPNYRLGKAELIQLSVAKGGDGFMPRYGLVNDAKDFFLVILKEHSD